MEPVSDTAGEGGNAASARRRIRRLVLAFLATVLMLGGLAGAWAWRTHPQAVSEDGSGFRTSVGADGGRLYVAVTYPDQDSTGTVSIDRAAPRTVENTAGATVDFYVCTLEGVGTGYDALGAAGPRGFAEMCPDAEPVREGSLLGLGEDRRQQLVMGVTVHRPGVVRIRGVDLTYSKGWQHGTQSVGPDLRIKAR